jgi:hypothetical protein
VPISTAGPQRPITGSLSVCKRTGRLVSRNLRPVAAAASGDCHVALVSVRPPYNFRKSQMPVIPELAETFGKRREGGRAAVRSLRSF